MFQLMNLLINVAFAGGLGFVESGAYHLVSGPKQVCADFQLSAAAAASTTLNLGQYSYLAANATHTMPSDLDEGCQFIETNQRLDQSSTSVILVRMNEEVCGPKVRSHIQSTATIGLGEIRVLHDIAGSEPYTCIWRK